MDPTPCARCGNFIRGEALEAGYTVCEECIARLVEGPPKVRSMANLGAGGGALLGVAVAVIGAVLVDPGFAVMSYYLVGGGAFVGLVIGLPFDTIRTRRARAAIGFEGIAWIAVLDREVPVRATRSGFAFLGTGRLLFASKAGDREVVQRQHVTRVKKLEEKLVELELALPSGAARLVVVGAGAGAATHRMLAGG